MSKATKLPGLKNIPPSTDKELYASLQAMKEALAVRLGQEGDPLDRAITLRELIDSGMAKKLTNKNFDPNTTTTDFVGATDDPVDLSIPPAPTGLEASGAFTEIVINWNPPTYSNHSFTEVFRSRDDVIGTAQLVTTTASFVTTDTVGYNQEYYYWVRFVSTSGVRGPFNQTNGVKASTVEDIAAVMTQLSESLSDLPGFNLLTTTAAAANVIKSSSEPSTRADGSSIGAFDIWFDTDDGQVYTRNASNNGWVAGRDATLVNLFGSTSFTGSTLTGAMATAQSDIVTVTNAQSSTATSVTNLTAYVGSGNDNSGTAYSASNTIISHVNATDANAAAAYVLKVEANGAVAGMVLEANASASGTGSAIQFQADKFAIWDGSGAASSNSVAPFIVSGGTVFIDSARIQDGAITNARIADATIEAAKIADATITAAKIGDGEITTAKIKDGDITTAKIGTGQITTALIGDAEITEAKISGTLSANVISTTNLILPATGGSTSISFSENNNQNRFICSVGSGAGFYQGFVKFTGSSNHVKSLGFYFIDSSATSGSGSNFEVNLDSSTGSNSDTNTPLAGKSVSSKAVYPSSNAVPSSAETDTVKTSGYGLRPFVLSHGVGFGSQGQLSNRRSTNENDDRLFSGHESVNIPITFTYTGSNSVSLFVRGQADSASGNSCTVEARFIRFGTS